MKRLGLDIANCKGDWALVTGASSGIGVEFCRQLAQAKMNVILIARRKERLETLAQNLKSQCGIQTLVVVQDLTAPQAAICIKNSVEQQGIKIRLLINNAGWGLWGRFEKNQVTDIAVMSLLNAAAPMMLCSVFLEHLKSFSSAGIINLSSPAALQPMPYKAVYGAAKSALHNFSLSLYEELKPHHIAVQTLLPGPTESELDEKGKAYKCKLTEQRETPQRLVRLSLDGLKKAKPFITSAKGVYQQRLFNGIFSNSVITKVVADMFYPQNGWKD